MSMTDLLSGPRRVGLYTIGLLIGTGALLFLPLVLEWPPPIWSRLALGLQGLALR